MFANVMGDSDWGHFIWLLDPSQFQPIDRFRSLMDKEIDRIKSSEKKSDVDEIFLRGRARPKTHGRITIFRRTSS
jgi:LDH2 family malate/lactate/ureidoglycolate dehydrogenase